MEYNTIIQKEEYYRKLTNIAYLQKHYIKYWYYNILYRYYEKKHLKIFESR